jgi:hypothetical protein
VADLYEAYKGWSKKDKRNNDGKDKSKGNDKDKDEDHKDKDDKNKNKECDEKIAYHRGLAADYTAAVNDLHWDADRAFWYDFNVTANARSEVYTPAGLWPLWQNVTPPELAGNEALARNVTSGLRFLLGKYAGAPSVASVLETGLNWDFPNVWPPHARKCSQKWYGLRARFDHGRDGEPPRARPRCSCHRGEDSGNDRVG